MTHKRNARAPRPDPAAQDPMDYLLGDVMQATDQIVAELREMEDLQADPLATLAGHCANLGGRVAALAEVVRQMRDQQRGLVVISDPEPPAFRQITEPELVAGVDLAAGVDPADVRNGLDAGTDGQQDGLRAMQEDLDASQPARRWTRAEALAEAERLGGLGGAIFLMHWEKNGGK